MNIEIDDNSANTIQIIAIVTALLIAVVTLIGCAEHDREMASKERLSALTNGLHQSIVGQSIIWVKTEPKGQP